jgi:hypothetical protein
MHRVVRSDTNANADPRRPAAPMKTGRTHEDPSTNIQQISDNSVSLRRHRGVALAVGNGHQVFVSVTHDYNGA